jgi:hypothetical protein
MKLMAIYDRHGLPQSVSTYAANHQQFTLVQLSFVFCMIEAKPEELIGDKACDNDTLQEELRHEWAKMITPHCSDRVKRAN